QGAVFGKAFAGESWAPWLAVASALDGLPLTPAEQALWGACTGRVDTPTEPGSELWVIAGRRSGKSRSAAAIATHAAISLDPALLAPGENAVSLIVAVDQKQATVVLNYCAGLLEASPLLKKLIVRRTADAIELANRTRIEVKSSNFRSVRGYTLACAVVDEIAFLKDETSATPDIELVRAVKPALVTTGGRLICISSPWAQRGILWKRHRAYFGSPGRVIIWQAGTCTMNPDFAQSVIDEARADDAEATAAEYDAQFRGDLESYISSALVEELT